MAESGDAHGWAPLDPEPTGERPLPPATSPAPPPPQAPPPQGWPQPGQYQGQYGHPGYPQPGYPQPGYPQPGYAYPGYGAAPAPKPPWAVDPPPGTPFHRMARTAAHRWWRPLAGTLGILGLGFGLAIGLMIIGMIVRLAATGDAMDDSASDSIFGDATADLAFDLGMLAVFLPVGFLAAWVVQRRRPGTLSSVAGRLRWRWLLACCGLAALFCVVSYGSSMIASTLVGDDSGSDEHWVGWGDFLAPAIVIILLVPFQSAAEEYVFRGWLLQAVGACTLETLRGRVGRACSAVLRTPWPGIVVGSALFTAGHGYTGWGVLDIFFFGALAAWLAVRTGGLESGIALHVFNNLMAFLFPAAVGKLDIEQGGVRWEYVLADIVPMVLYALAVVWLARRMRIQTLTAETREEPGPDAPPAPARVGGSPGPEFAA
ncbi:CPBP family intramembrane glutamic endopeptidase [Actinomadura sp. NEAU-AAG7]|uniref:CPBP family intramembrane glutamic endopeptidase n=1 Tax=Actinomadura sp. NEAU-AAG7 TaxID=2839640 RepID=UPI001BE46961|nr:CPBP family intramembrane glutamic endopeptidase [Actinomadura sp. NEAU-AAG7]MBT2208532.1 CPBP family intramembrane metalloprotease [Actinomadura sp. NEAU-AAG7]